MIHIFVPDVMTKLRMQPILRRKGIKYMFYSRLSLLLDNTYRTSFIILDLENLRDDIALFSLHRNVVGFAGPQRTNVIAEAKKAGIKVYRKDTFHLILGDLIKKRISGET